MRKYDVTLTWSHTTCFGKIEADSKGEARDKAEQMLMKEDIKEDDPVNRWTINEIKE